MPIRALALAWRTARIRKELRRLHGARVLDIGCGDGGQLADLAPSLAEGVGIDPDPAAIERARSRHSHPRLRFEAKALGALARPCRGRFDLVLMIGSLEHMPDPREAIAHAADQLAPGGRMLIVMPDPRHPRSWIHRLQGRLGPMPPFRHLPPSELRRLARSCGLRPAEPRPGLPERLERILWRLLIGSSFLLFERAPEEKRPDGAPRTSRGPDAGQGH